MLATAVVDAPFGALQLAATGTGLAVVGLPGTDVPALLERAEALPTTEGDGQAHVEQAAQELREYFAGRRTEFTVALDHRLRTAFGKAVSAGMLAVPFGRTASYGELADAIGRPRASRAVGRACATNPLPIIVPCHRILDAAGRLNGYAGTLPVKAQLLQLEGAGFRE